VVPADREEPGAGDRAADGEHRALGPAGRGAVIALTLAGIALVVNQIFNLQLFGVLLFDNSYLYLLLAIFLSMIFLVRPMRSGRPTARLFWLDVGLAIVALGIGVYFAWNGQEIVRKGWGYLAPGHVIVLAGVSWVLILEAVRRAAGSGMLVVVVLFSLYPVAAQYLPGMLEGPRRSLTTTAVFHLLSLDSVLGIPMAIFANILIGFIFFGVVLQATGGGAFFLDLANSLLGTSRGGPAKVAVLSSSLFGSINGSAISNVVTSGSVTIPAMKKAGYARETAAAIEVCASTGGVLMPPVMGAVAFVMAAILGTSYATIALAALVPSLLYYLGLFVQVDGYAAKHRLCGATRSEIPPLLRTLRRGWIYLVVMAVLLYYLFGPRMVGEAPFYASALLLVLSLVRADTRFSLAAFLGFIETTGRFLAQLVAIMAGVGMVMGALVVTGIGATLSRELTSLAGGNSVLLLIFGALASYILGMGMTVTACYVFLAVVLAPALVTAGYEPIAVHLFLLYWGMLSYITPPIALAAYPAAAIAGGSPLRTAFEASRMGGAIYFVSFLFVFQPALLLQADPWSALSAIAFAVPAVFLIASAFGGYLAGVGTLESGGVSRVCARWLLVAAGTSIALPSWPLKGLGAGLLVIALLLRAVPARFAAGAGAPSSGR
jgi:TRAP transporter 4TM/12TM fusion protein